MGPVHTVGEGVEFFRGITPPMLWLDKPLHLPVRSFVLTQYGYRRVTDANIVRSIATRRKNEKQGNICC